MLRELGAALSGTYEVERELGGGGMSRVFVARDLRLDRRVVIKVLPHELSATMSVERFRREIQLAARLRHPHIVPLLDAGEADGLLFYTMPLIEGESVRERLRRDGKIPRAEALRLAADVADALAYAHAQGVVHRDIKPDNILLDSGHAVVTDFGIARAISESETAPLTGTGMGIGTLAYMSPEQATGGHAVDARSDIYSLGCVLYEMISGAPALAARSAITNGAQLHRVLGPALPLVVRALEPEPAARYESAAAFRDAIGRVQAGSVRRRRPAALGALAVIGTAVVVAAGTRTLRSHSASDIEWSRRQLTYSGTVLRSVISPDGAYLLLLSSRSDAKGLDSAVVLDLQSGTTRPILGADAMNQTISPQWGHGGRAIRYYSDSAIREVQVLGGAPRIVATGRVDGFAFSPDEGRLLRWKNRWSGTKSDCLLLLTAADGTGAIDTLSMGNEVTDCAAAAWSPSGRWIAVHGNTTGGAVVMVVPVNHDPAVIVARSNFSNPYIAWSPGGDAVYFITTHAMGHDSASWSIASVRVNQRNGQPQGEPIALLPGVTAREFSVTAGGAIAYVPEADRGQVQVYTGAGVGVNESDTINTPAAKDSFTRGIWLPRGGRWINAGTESMTDPSLSPDGTRLAYVREQPNGNDIFARDLTGGTPVRATSIGSPLIHTIRWSPDGRMLAFVTAVDGTTMIGTVPAGGGGARLFRADGLTAARVIPVGAIAWTTDDRAVLFIASSGDQRFAELKRLDVTTGGVATIYKEDHGWVFGLAPSPDGREVAVSSGNAARTKDRLIRVSLVDGRVTEIPTQTTSGDSIWAAALPFAWTADGRIFVMPASGRIGQVSRVGVVTATGGRIEHFRFMQRCGQPWTVVAQPWAVGCSTRSGGNRDVWLARPAKP